MKQPWASLGHGLAMVVAVIGMTSTASIASAEESGLPSANACAADARTRRGYLSGWRGGQDLVSMATHGPDPCADLADVDRIVSDALARVAVPRGASEYVRCRTRGMIDGAEDALDALRRACTDGGV